VRQDIRAGFGDASGVAEGALLAIALRYTTTALTG